MQVCDFADTFQLEGHAIVDDEVDAVAAVKR
jgi:hypothetical protein